MRYFKVAGEVDPLTGEQLYWSNDLGWVDFESATLFTEEELIRCYLLLGMTKIVPV